MTRFLLTIAPDSIRHDFKLCRVRATIVSCETNLMQSGGIGANRVENDSARFLRIPSHTIYVSFLSNPSNSTFNFNIIKSLEDAKIQNFYLHVTHSSFSIVIACDSDFTMKERCNHDVTLIVVC